MNIYKTISKSKVTWILKHATRWALHPHLSYPDTLARITLDPGYEFHTQEGQRKQ